MMVLVFIPLSSAFVPSARGPLSSVTGTQYRPLLPQDASYGNLKLRGATQLSLVRELLVALENLPKDFDLSFGAAVIAMAMTPYVAGLVLPNFLHEKFFIDIYRDDIKESNEVRDAEMYWKLMFAALGLGTITYIFIDAANGAAATQALRSTYIIWALFYLSATLKIYKERELLEKRGFIQAWHLFVAVALFMDVGMSPGSVAFLKTLG